jgi:hypothetical protein
MNEPLKPCPFCGGDARPIPGKQYKIMIQDWHDADEALYLPCVVKCHDCTASVTQAACKAEFGGANGAAIEARRRAIEAWNRRAFPDLSKDFETVRKHLNDELMWDVKEGVEALDRIEKAIKGE